MKTSAEPVKILSEFHILPAGAEQVQMFFNDRLKDLCGDADRPAARKKTRQQHAQKELAALLWNPNGAGVLPGALVETLQHVLTDQSDLALLIHGFPERKGFERFAAHAAPELSYSYHLGNALYDICDARHVNTQVLKRFGNGRLDNYTTLIHRDSLGKVGLRQAEPGYGEYIALSCPLNLEDAVTEVIRLRQTIERLTEEERGSIKVRTGRQNAKGEQRYEEYNLNEVLRILSEAPLSQKDFLREFMLLDNGDSPALAKFQQALGECSIKVVLQPGGLLFINEHTMFHRGHESEKGRHYPTCAPTRLLIHNAGAPEGQAARV